MRILAVPRSPLQKRIVSLQYLTLGWMLVECSVALTAAVRAGSVSLLAFGSDSLVELISAAGVLSQFTGLRIAEVRAARFCGLLLYVLAAVIAIVALAGLRLHAGAETSGLGIAVTAGALLLMPVLARMKRGAAAQASNKALRADAVQSATCAYLAGLTLGGLLLRAAFGIGWLDPVAALAAVPILVVEARKARAGHVCGC